MKKVLLTVGIMLTQLSFATSIQDVRLRLKISPIERGLLGGEGKETHIVVTRGGNVTGYTCEMVGGDARRCQSKQVAQLDKYEMKNIDTLILRAKRGAMVSDFEIGIAVCLAIPTESYVYSAGNDTIQLLNGSRPCGGELYNDTISAQRLVEKLDRYLAKYKQ